jgi:Domain of unknown function (DUF1330)
MRSRNVLRQFGSFDEALTAYRSPEYSAARLLRALCAQCDFLIVEGFEGTQPERIGTPPAAAPRPGDGSVHCGAGQRDRKAYQIRTACLFVESLPPLLSSPILLPSSDGVHVRRFPSTRLFVRAKRKALPSPALVRL